MHRPARACVGRGICSRPRIAVEPALRELQQRRQLAKRVGLEAQRQILQCQVQMAAAAQGHMADRGARQQARRIVKGGAGL